MQWRKASEKLPEKEGTYVYKHPVDGIGTTYYDPWNEHDSGLDDDEEWLDETPTTLTGWPDSEEIRIAAKKYSDWNYPNDGVNRSFCFHNYYDGIEWMINWLKSHTAPKAEEPHSTAEVFNVKKAYNKWLNELTAYEVSCIFDMMEDYASQFKQSPSINTAQKEEPKDAVKFADWIRDWGGTDTLQKWYDSLITTEQLFKIYQDDTATKHKRPL